MINSETGTSAQITFWHWDSHPLAIGRIWGKKLEKSGVLFGETLGGGDEDFGGAAGGGLLADDDFDVAVEGGQEIHEAFDGKTSEAVVG